MPELTAFEIAVIAIGFFLGGFVKGVSAIGLPFFALSVSVTVIPLPLALALLSVSNLSSNIYQTVTAGFLPQAIRRFWTLLIPLVALTFPAAQVMASMDRHAGEIILGGLCLGFCALQFLPGSITVPKSWEVWMSPALGVFGGILCGLSGLFGPPLVMYLIALRLPKEEFVSSASLCFICGAGALYTSLAFTGILTLEVVGAAMLASLPVFAGLWIGGLLRGRINENRFRQLLIVLLFGLGVSLLYRGLFR